MAKSTVKITARVTRSGNVVVKTSNGHKTTTKTIRAK